MGVIPLVLLLLTPLVSPPASRCPDTATGMERSFRVFADYHQFVVADDASRWKGLAEGWTPAAVEDGVVRGADFVGVGTGTDLEVTVTLRVLPAEPPGGSDGGDRVREARIAVSSGELVVTAVTAGAGEGERVALAPGDHAVRMSARGLGTAGEHHLVEIWPVD